MDEIETILNYIDNKNDNSISPIKVTIKNGRSRINKLDDCSFELTKHKTILIKDDFYYNEEKIKTIYYDEIKILLMKLTGCSDVHIIHHNINNNNNTNNNDNHSICYTNYTSCSAKNLFLKSYQTIPPKSGAYSLISIIRNISEIPMNNKNIVLCDERSIVKPDDYISHNKNQQYYLDNNNSYFHQWYYFPFMKNDEVLLIKEFDSRTDITGRICFQSEINSNVELSDIQKFETIEVRALLYFGDYYFNNCPLRIPGKDYNGSDSNKQEENNSFSWLNGMYSWMIPTTTKSENVSIDEGVMKCESSLKYINHWPRDVIIRIKNEVNKPNAAFEFATDLVTDNKNILGLEKISLDTKEKIIKKLMERGFEKKFMKAFKDI